MFIRKFLKPNQVDEVNAKGRFIKVMNCEGVFRIRALSQGRALVDTDAAAGFDIQTNETFDFIEITSDIEQKLQLWASEHKLSYDALSTKPSRSNSYIVSHFGGSQQIAPYNPEQSSIIVICDTLKSWVGGDGVDNYSGIPLLAGEKYKHESAAPLHIYIDQPRDSVIDFTNKTESPLDGAYMFNEAVCIGGYIYHTDTVNLHKTNPISGDTITAQQGALSPIEHNGEIVGIRNNDKRDLVIYNADNMTFSYKRDPNTTLNKAVLLSDAGAVFALGKRKAGSTPWKLTKYQDGLFSQQEVSTDIDADSVSCAKIDPFTGDWWITAGPVYRSADRLQTVEDFAGLNSITGRDIKFTERHVFVMTTSNNVLILNKESKEVIDANAHIQDIKGFYAIGEQWVFVSGEYVYVTYDEFNTISVMYEHSAVIANDYAPIIEYQQGYAVCGVDTANGEGVWVVGSQLAEVEKARFRVFKESF